MSWVRFVAVGGHRHWNFYGDFPGQNAQGHRLSQTQHTGPGPGRSGQDLTGPRALLSQVEDVDDQADLSVAVTNGLVDVPGKVIS